MPTTTKTMKKRIPLPSQIKIGSVKFSVSNDRSAYYELARKYDEHGVYGYMNYRTQRIVLDPEQGPDCEKDTLLHEALHVIWEQGGGCDRYKEKLEEDVILMMSPLLLQVIQDNPKLIAYLQDV